MQTPTPRILDRNNDASNDVDRYPEKDNQGMLYVVGYMGVSIFISGGYEKE